MKMEKFGKLVKDILLAGAFFGLAMLLNMGSDMTTQNQIAIALFASGIPFGWRWASNIMTAVSVQGVLIKLGFSLLLGWLALMIALVGDVIAFLAAPRSASAA